MNGESAYRQMGKKKRIEQCTALGFPYLYCPIGAPGKQQVSLAIVMNSKHRILVARIDLDIGISELSGQLIRGREAVGTDDE